MLVAGMGAGEEGGNCRIGKAEAAGGRGGGREGGWVSQYWATAEKLSSRGGQEC